MTARSIRTTLTELRSLRRRIGLRGLEEQDWPILDALLFRDISRAERQLAKALAKAAMKAHEPADPGVEAARDVEAVGDAEAADEGAAPQGPSVGGASSSAPQNAEVCAPAETEPAPKHKGHGRNGAGAFVGAEHCVHALLEGTLGALCQACGMGSMSRYREKLIVVVKGQPLFDSEIHHFEQARCRLCGAIVRAPTPGATLGVVGSDYITYDSSACAMLLVMHYFAGMPFKRLESLQAGWGTPMPDANQWTLADECADLLFPLYKALECHGIKNAVTLRIDDTGSMVIAVRREIRQEVRALEALGKSSRDVRTAINATGVYLETEQGKVLLFFTGRHHAGEIVDQILKHRHVDPDQGNKLVKVTDAASKNFAHAHHDELDEAVCNAHAYLKFRAIKDRHREEYGLAGEVYKNVFDHDDIAAAKGMSAHERMLYHRQHSLPEMKRLKKMCRDKLESRLVEPNSPLWEPLTFILNQWERLTKFCEVPGVPLDTNVVEQMLIIPVRYLAGSFNYQTQNGADVGDRHMSLIATANANGIEPVAYLAECIENHEDLKRRPEHYLPWAYRDRLQISEKTGTAFRVQTTEHPLRPGTRRATEPTRLRPEVMTTAPP